MKRYTVRNSKNSVYACIMKISARLNKYFYPRRTESSLNDLSPFLETPVLARSLVTTVTCRPPSRARSIITDRRVRRLVTLLSVGARLLKTRDPCRTVSVTDGRKPEFGRRCRDLARPLCSTGDSVATVPCCRRIWSPVWCSPLDRESRGNPSWPFLLCRPSSEIGCTLW